MNLRLYGHKRFSTGELLPRLFFNIFISLSVLFLACQPVVGARSDPGLTHMYQALVAEELIEIELPFIVPEFIQSMPGDAVQIASAVRWNPFFEVSLSADSVYSPAGGLDPQISGQTPAYQQKKSLQNFRGEQESHPLPAHKISFFGQESVSVSNRVSIFLNPAGKEPVIIHEWVVEANHQLWTFRISYTPGQDFAETGLDGIVIRSAGPAKLGNSWDAESQAAKSAAQASPALPVDPPLEDDLPAPDWWDGECDTVNYEEIADQPAYPLEGVYRGVRACGPRPWGDDAPDVLVRFFEGAWGELEWQCVELSMRFLYLAYDIAPYPGNGKDVVANYPGTFLIKVPNGAGSRGPDPGDVLSYGPTTTYGHTSVVSESTIDANGNGTITIIEQNSSETGITTHNVKNWYVQSNMTVSGWLHNPTGDIEQPEKFYLPAVVSWK